jgi:hypothetical protein
VTCSCDGFHGVRHPTYNPTLSIQISYTYLSMYTYIQIYAPSIGILQKSGLILLDFIRSSKSDSSKKLGGVCTYITFVKFLQNVFAGPRPLLHHVSYVTCQAMPAALTRVARWHFFQTQNPNLGKFWRVLQ